MENKNKPIQSRYNESEFRPHPDSRVHSDSNIRDQSDSRTESKQRLKQGYLPKKSNSKFL